MVRNSSGSENNPTTSPNETQTSDERKLTTSRKRDFNLTGQLSPPREHIRPVTDDDRDIRMRYGPRPILPHHH